MKVLVVTGMYPTEQRPEGMVFVKEQVEALRATDPNLHVDIYNYEGYKSKGNYLKAGRHVRRVAGDYDVIHAHYGLSGTLAILQNKTPVVTTYHGSDLMLWSQRLFSRPAMRRSARNIIVAPHLARPAMGGNYTVLPCGVDFGLFYPMEKPGAKKRQGLNPDKKYILFPGDPKDPVRNFQLFKTAFDLVGDPQLGILTLINKNRTEVNEIINAAEVMVFTSIRAGSPQVVKEAIRCNVPVVSLDVGDVKERLEGLAGSTVVAPEPAQLAGAIRGVLEMDQHPDYTAVWDDMDNKKIAGRLLALYNNIS